MELVSLDIDGKRHELAASLVWHPLQAAGAQRAQEILAFARAAGADLKLLRGDEAPHVGLASRRDGARPGQVCAAAVIADALAQEGHRSALAALRLPQAPERLHYLAMRDGVILADGDSVAAEPEIRRRLLEDSAYGGWDCVICPPSWGIPAGGTRGFDSFFPPELWKKSKRWQLQELRINVGRLAVVMAVLLTMGLVTGWSWRTYQAQLQVAQAVAQAQRQQAQREREEPDLRVSAQLPPWPRLPRASAFAQACVSALVRTGTVAGNWKFDGAVCEAGLLTARWIKTSEAAWVSHLQAMRPHALIAADGMSATVSVPANAPPEGDAREPLPSLQSARLRYLGLAASYGMRIRIEESSAPRTPPQLPGQSRAPAPPPPAWAEATVHAGASFDPVEAARLLEAPGLRLSRLVVSVGREGRPQYQFTGVHYVQP